MAPVPGLMSTRAAGDPLAQNLTRSQVIGESWAQGFNIGSVVILLLFVLCNYRKGVVLHKLILLELFLAGWNGIFIFFDDPAYGWILSSTAALLYISYNLHNVISWFKIKPFLPRWGGLLFIISLMLVQPYWVLETVANFQYFNLLGNNMFTKSRYVEPIARDPWWIFTTVKLVMVINKNYGYTLVALIRTSPRFGVLLLCMFMSIIFLATDVAVTATMSSPSGINPFWRLALVFKCASDVIFLDDFKSVLDHIAETALRRINNSGQYGSSLHGLSARHNGSNTRQISNLNSGPVVAMSTKNKRGNVAGVTNAASGWTPSRLARSRLSLDSDEIRLGLTSVEGSRKQNDGNIMTKTMIVISDQSDVSHTHSCISADTYGSKEDILGTRNGDKGQHEQGNRKSGFVSTDIMSNSLEKSQPKPSPTGDLGPEIPMVPIKAQLSLGGKRDSI
ncbi:unnamed protein product [Clonostachys rosea f. rosea IK726]|uniref:Uncharacterized protein n=2 Tax=Bionectria ochroleuca TaxID=29856 RepID=A0A0B7KE01_BIOOC|nr:unnamed protein product [Clonostachys rosea f. rosea IK726]